MTLRRIVLAGCAMAAVALGIRSVSRFRVWESNRTLTLYSMVDAPRSWRVQQSYGELLFDEGRILEGSAAFQRAAELAPETWRPRNRFAERLLQTGRDSLALDQLRRSLAENPGRIETYIRLPAALLAVGDYERARTLADSIIVAENAPPIMVGYRAVADSALKLKAPAGSVRVFPF
jgi:Flp pilus assembly protein TadD